MAYVRLDGHTQQMTDGKLEWNGRRILTVDLAAPRYNLSKDAAQKAIQRFVKAGKLTAITPPPLGLRTPAYYATDLDKLMRDERPGKGANWRTRPARPSA